MQPNVYIKLYISKHDIIYIIHWRTLKSILYKNILKILLTQEFAEIAPANQGQIMGADSAIFWVSRI